MVYDSNGICYAVRHDTGWTRERPPPAGAGPRLSYDSADAPLVISGGERDWAVREYATARTESGWVTTELLEGGPEFFFEETHTSGRFSRDNIAHVFAYDYWEFESHYWHARLSLFEGHGDQWQVTWDSSLPSWGYEAWALALDTADVPAYCFTDPNGGLFFVDQCIDTLAWGAALQFDMLNRPHVAYVANSWSPGRLKYAYRTRGIWFISEVPDTCAVVGCDLLLDTLAEPVIAYVRSDGGLWLAHGVDVVGQSEEPGESVAYSSQLQSSGTCCSNLFLQSPLTLHYST